MKILCVDTQSSGHHPKYYNSLERNLKGINIVGMFPELDEDKNIGQYTLHKGKDGFSIFNYFRVLLQILKVSKNEHADSIHFLYADYLIRYFGIFLWIFPKRKMIGTFHHIKRGWLRDFALRRICGKMKVCIVHTASLKKALNMMGIQNVVHIEYPVFFDPKDEGVLPEDVGKIVAETSSKVMLAVGSTRYDKGLDLLLNALNKVDMEFKLIIAGRESFLKKEKIKELSKGYSNNVILHLDELSDEELIGLYRACDIVVLPYRKVFDGASGPLAEGVFFNKIILGPDHGSLGSLINDNNLGYTFKTEDIDDLANTIKTALNEEFVFTQKYFEYMKKLSQKEFASQYEGIYRR